MSLENNTMTELERMAQRIRLNAIEMAYASGKNGAHLGGGLSCADIMAVLYGDILRLDVQNPTWEERDRFLPSKNHCVLAHFPALFERGFIREEELLEFQKDGGRLTGYPRNPQIGLEYSGGSLGMAISVGIGIAYHLKERKSGARVFVLMGDGELNEGSIWEAMMAGAQFGLDNLTAIIDRNHLSYDGDTEKIMALEPLHDKFTSFGWHTISCNGHNVSDLLHAFYSHKQGKPNVIIADTIKGKGVSFMENKREWHHSRLSKEQYEQAKAEIMEVIPR